MLRIAGIDLNTNGPPGTRGRSGLIWSATHGANAIVSTDLPSTISISVLERVPVAVALTTEDGRLS